MYGSNAITYDPERHAAAWGARLIFEEVMEGGGGVVYDRQSGEGAEDPEAFARLTASYKPFLDHVRTYLRPWDSGSSEKVWWTDPTDPAIHWVASPQGSYGYLYVKGVVLREVHDPLTTDLPDEADDAAEFFA